MSKKKQNKVKCWVITVDMGYGHQRAAYPLRHLASGGEIINANTYPGIPSKDRARWRQSRKFYELISRFKTVPIIGNVAFDVFDYFQSIDKFYPKRDLSESTLQLKEAMSMIKDDWGKHLIQKLSKKPLPFITTFFIPAYMADYYQYPGDIYLVICDADISRAWAPLNPSQSRIKYFAPSERVRERLKLYGVKEENIYLTGFPLPWENINGGKLDTLRHDLGQRIPNLDPLCVYRKQYAKNLAEHLGKQNYIHTSKHPLTITFAVGGVGAQREIGGQILKSLREELVENKIAINLIAGIHNDVNSYFKKAVKRLALGAHLGKNINIMFSEKKKDYFKKFNQILRTTDILWTKPSELSFYAGLGIPIIIAPPIGSQEKFNRQWLKSVGCGLDQEDPLYTHQWLYDWLKSGWFAEAAMQGYLEVEKYGTINVEKVIKGEFKEEKAHCEMRQWP